MSQGITRLMLAAALALSGVPAFAKAPEKKASPAKAPPKATGQVLDDFSKMDWGTARDQSSEIKLEQAAGMGGNALKMTYNLKSGKWVAVNKGILIDDFRGKSLSFWLKGKGANNNLEVKLVDDDDSNYGVKRPVLSENGDWVQVVLSEAEFSYWWGGDTTLNRVKDIYFAVSAGDGGAGEVLISDLRLGTASKEGNIGKGGVVFNAQSKDGWMVAKGEGSTIMLEMAPGKSGKAMAVKYSFPAGQWVSIRRSLNADLSGGNASLLINLKGDGDPTDVEVKLVDRDDSTFAKVFKALGASNQWQEYRIPLSDLQYMWGGDNRLDVSLIRYLDIAISGAGGQGRVLVGEIKVAK